MILIQESRINRDIFNKGSTRERKKEMIQTQIKSTICKEKIVNWTGVNRSQQSDFKKESSERIRSSLNKGKVGERGWRKWYRLEFK